MTGKSVLLVLQQKREASYNQLLGCVAVEREEEDSFEG